MATVKLRNPRVSDAKRYLEIIANPKFIYFTAPPKDLKAEIEFIRTAAKKRRKKEAFTFAILYNGKHVGGCGMFRISARDAHVCEAGYFIDEAFHRKGIAPAALELLEEFIKSRTKFKRIELLIAKENKPSIKVAKKCGYVFEGILKKRIFVRGKYHDAAMFAKIVA